MYCDLWISKSKKNSFRGNYMRKYGVFDLKSTELSHNIYFIYIECSAQTDSCLQHIIDEPFKSPFPIFITFVWNLKEIVTQLSWQFFFFVSIIFKNISVLLKVFTIWLEIPKVSLLNTTIVDPCSTKKEARQCRLNGKAVLKLNEDLGAKMRPLDSRTVFIDVKVRPLNVY